MSAAGVRGGVTPAGEFLPGYCYRMLGSVFEADDAVQETMVRAWRGLDGFEGRSAMPPYDFWLRGPVEMGRWFLGQGCGCRGSRLVAAAASGCAGFGSYRPDPHGGRTSSVTGAPSVGSGAAPRTAVLARHLVRAIR